MKTTQTANIVQIWAFVAKATVNATEGFNTGLEGFIFPIKSMHQLKDAQEAFKNPDASEPSVKCVTKENRSDGIEMYGYVQGRSKQNAQLLLNRWCHVMCPPSFQSKVISIIK